ncbi:PAS domain S-box-containing protein [Halobellus clavatus]|uniref:PAS domain S-box-containing protein n=1 Tax=Halobellus clavatus TaxID=660517 RepID=A0A1H3HEH2_9EURY|nr:PAS domain S-box-containing protein [Halobellus clavatus]
MATSPLSEMAPFNLDHRLMSVLLVDDDESLVDMSSVFLEREIDNIETTTLTDPEAVLDEVDDGNYDCIVSDFDMPRLDGLELLTKLREDGVEIPFVLFTGKGSEEIASQAITAGVDEYLQKGGTEEYPVLANKIENLVEKYWAETQVQRGFLAIESAEEGIGIIDEDGVYQYMNEAYAGVYNRDRAELVGEHWDMLYPPEETERFHDEILPELETTGAWRGVSTGVTKQGDPVPERLVLTQMDSGGHVCIVQELDQNDELEAELALKNRALDATGLGVVITDASQEDNPIIYLNEGFEELTGYDEEEVLGRNCRFLQGEDTNPDTVAAIREAVDTGESISTDILNYDADGNPFWNLLEIFPIADETGDITNFVGFQREISDRRAHTEDIESQLDWLGEFGHVLSHDLKTPLSVIQGNLELAQELDDTDRLDDAVDAADRLEALVDDLANVMQQGDLVTEVEPVELGDVFRSWDAFETNPESLDVLDSKPILADEHALVRLADNLVKNTVEHAGDGTAMRVGTLADGFYYEDDGPGIPESERDDVFKPGFTTKEDGTGFGMVSIKQIALAHGWEVTIDESEAGGARFEFTGIAEPQ